MMGRQRTYSGRKQKKYVYVRNLKDVMNGHSDNFSFPSSLVITDVIKYGFNKKFLIPPSSLNAYMYLDSIVNSAQESLNFFHKPFHLQHPEVYLSTHMINDSLIFHLKTTM